jgi:hypothetical protein
MVQEMGIEWATPWRKKRKEYHCVMAPSPQLLLNPLPPPPPHTQKEFLPSLFIVTDQRWLKGVKLCGVQLSLFQGSISMDFFQSSYFKGYTMLSIKYRYTFADLRNFGIFGD